MLIVLTFIAIVAGVFITPISLYYFLRQKAESYGLRRDPLTGKKLDRPHRPWPNAAQVDLFDWRNIFAAIAFLLLLPWFGSRFYYRPSYSGPVPEWINTCFVISAISAIISLIGHLTHKLLWRRKALAANFELCLECGYFLNKLPIKHTCPECGTPYDLYVVKRTWTACVRNQS